MTDEVKDEVEPSEKKHRQIHFDIDIETFNRFKAVCPEYGMQSIVMRRLFKFAVRAMETKQPLAFDPKEFNF